MEEPKSFTSGIFEADGNKYAINPFATYEENETRVRHSEPYTSFCSQCNLHFEDLIEYEKHNTEIHSQKKIHTCTSCNATFKRLDHLKRHIQSIHPTERNVICPVCDENCVKRDLLLKHIKKKHLCDDVVFKCRNCNVKCTSLKELEDHEKKHMLAGRHVCTYCETTFKRRDHMLRHVKSQHLNQCVSCPLCGQVYKRKDHVARHMREKHSVGHDRNVS